MLITKKKVLLLILMTFIGAFSIYAFKIIALVKYEVASKENYLISLKLENVMVKELSADPLNKLTLNASIRDTSGNPVPMAKLNISINNNIGTVTVDNFRTDKNGNCHITYFPPINTENIFVNGNPKIEISATIKNTSLKSTANFTLTPIPLIYIHGYLAHPDMFDSMKEYFKEKGIESSGISYMSEKGIVEGSKELNNFLTQQTLQYISQGLQVSKFNIIAHSMGGLVARYYSTSPEYIRNENIQKLIFIAVPHKGSPWASLGSSYYNNQGIKDLIPDNLIFTQLFPSMLNKGLNNHIQVGNIMDQFDEVVSLESSSLEEWGISTDLFNIGESNFTMDKLLNGQIAEAPNHKGVLSNKKIFEKINTMLTNNLPYPQLKTK